MAADLRLSGQLSDCHGQPDLLPPPKHLRINAYILMPTHLHLIAFDADWDPARLVRTLADFRKYTGRQLSDCCTRHGPPSFLQMLRAQATADRERRFWQPGRHPEAIQSEPFWRQKLDYLHDNPCRKGLVRSPDYWRYSSARWYVSNGAEAGDVPLTALVW
jgi:hypothetical protein